MSDSNQLAEHLQLTARDLAGLFTDCELIHDQASLTKLGSGTLWIDLITGTCRHNGHPINQLHISGMLCGWLSESLVNAQLPKTAAQDAALVVRIAIEHYREQRHTDVRWANPATGFVGCRTAIRCRVAANGVEAEAERNEEMEWPEPSAA
jgi:hypothetical protein